MNKKINRPEDAGTSPDHKNKTNDVIIIPFHINFKNSERRFAEANGKLDFITIYDYDTYQLLTGADVLMFLNCFGISELKVDYFV